MKTYEVTKEESELIQKSTRKHLICKNKRTGKLYEVNPLEMEDWEKYDKEYFSFDQVNNLWIDKEIGAEK